jgi:hypothetical protein
MKQQIKRKREEASSFAIIGRALKFTLAFTLFAA